MTPIISPNIRLRHPETFSVGEHSIVDDFSYFSTRVRIGVCSHVASGCTIAGGQRYEFVLGDFSSVSSGVRIWCGSDDFVHDVVAILPPGFEHLKTHFIAGDVIMRDYTALGANTVVMPDNVIPEGTTIGALSLVLPGTALEPWSVYAGIPVKLVARRDKESVLAQVAAARAALGMMRERPQ